MAGKCTGYLQRKQFTTDTVPNLLHISGKCADYLQRAGRLQRIRQPLRERVPLQ
jgi:hypothetical protein